MRDKDTRFHLFLLLAFFMGLILSAIRPHDYLTWTLEVFPAVIAAIILISTYRSFRFTALVYILILVHAWVLLIGGHYTYAKVPLFNWIRDNWGLSRNYYDRVGHFFQGFTPAMAVREILIRKSPVKTGGWLFFMVVCICLAASAFYEFIEWWTSVATGAAAEEFLAIQGDVWDTQWDMFMALIGSIVAQLLPGRTHDRALKEYIGR